MIITRLPNQQSARVSMIRLVLLLTFLSVATVKWSTVSSVHSKGSKVNPLTEAKRSQPDFVPGQVLVRYRSEARAGVLERTKKSLRVQGRNVAMKIQRLPGVGLTD